MPYAISHFPAREAFTYDVLTGILYLGIISACIGFLIYIKAIEIIGPTPCALFSNFMPVTTTFFGWVILNEHVSPMQLMGGVVVIASGALVIRQKGKEDKF